MSLLNSVLSSINPGQVPPVKPSTSTSSGSSTKPNPVPRRENGSLNPARPQPTSSNLPPKRKAEDVGRDLNSKAPRVESANALGASIARSATNSPAQRQGFAPPPKVAVPYRGTMGTSKPPATSIATSAPRPAPAVSSAPPIPLVAPKSGYLAALERAKAAQNAAKKVGQIQHKPVEKLTKKDRLRMQAEAAAAQKGAKVAPGRAAAATKARSKSAEPLSNKAGPVKKDRKPTDVGYKGTMRAGPTPLAYSGTMRPSGSAVRKSQPAPSKGGERYRYASYSDEEEDDMSEQEDYETDSDMEAGMDEVDAEEEEAARIARREDAEALREENELKRAKLERKRKMEQLAAAAKKKNNNRY